MVSVRSVTVNLKADISDFQRKMLEAGAMSKGLSTELESAGSGMSNLVAAGIALGPALVPVAAAATVGVAALGTQLSFAAAGAGVALLAFHGVGDALKALETFSGAPTQANLTALQAKLAGLSSAGRDFVFFLDSVEPKLKALESTAQTGFLPGLQAGISTAMQQFPVVNRLVSDLASTMGQLAKEGGQAFDTPFWHGFLTDFARNASTALSTMAQAIGNVATGFAGMFEAFLPVGASLSQELLKLSQEFAAWGQGLANNNGFQQFIQYVQATAPSVMATLASLAKAILAIAKAAAPVGQVTLPAIKAVADTLTALANSGVGPEIIGIAVAVSSLAKALTLLKAVGFGSAAAGAAGKAGVLGKLGSFLGIGEGASAGAIAASAGALAGFAAALGSAVAGIGDAVKADGALSTSVKNVGDAFSASTLNLKAESDSLKGLQTQISATQAHFKSANQDVFTSWNPLGILKDMASVDWHTIFDPNGEADAIDQLNAHAQQLGTTVDELSQFRNALQGFPQDSLKGATTDLGQLQATADKAFPILQKVGYSFGQIQNMMKTERGRQQLADSIIAFNQAASSTSGKTKAVTDAIAELDSKLTATATAAQDVQTALTNLLGPGLTNVQATDAWTTALRGLDAQLAQHSKNLSGSSNDAIKNRAAINGLVTNYEALITAGAGIGQSSKQFSDSMQHQYYALIHAGVGAGIARSDMIKYLATIGLTPKTIHTIISQSGAQDAQSATQNLIARYNALPVNVRTDIAANGIPTTEAGVDALQKKYGLTPKQITTILQARDNASIIIDNLRAKLAALNGTTATTTIVTRLETQHITQFIHSGAQPGQADGGILSFANGGGIPSIGSQPPQIQPNHGPRGIMWAETGAGPWEAFISGHPAKAPASRSIADEVVGRLGGRVQWMADGGFIGQRMSTGGSESFVASLDALHREVAGLRTDIGTVKQHVVVDNASEVATGVRQVADGTVRAWRSYDQSQARAR
ncbi:MAG: hypothetical protein QOI06_237 [Nocardioidaceae bacterium]|jgi:hypothetical protein|nr:hypothetical protein [Nocardioidaceae bacterium]